MTLETQTNGLMFFRFNKETFPFNNIRNVYGNIDEQYICAENANILCEYRVTVDMNVFRVRDPTWGRGGHQATKCKVP